MQGHGYKWFARATHRLALHYAAVAEISFDIESTVFKDRPALADHHVFISGLARSGSTMLLQYLHQTGQFRSLTYRDMPFVLMPGLWKKLAGRQLPDALNERAHQDGIMINLDSPEAFEEVFWRVFCGRDYILKDRLRAHKVSVETSEKFKNYIGNVLRSSDSVGEQRYLSKNNNNILRIGYLQKAFPRSFIIIPFRDPLQQAISLLRQHLHFLKLHAEDKFALSYMNWLGHFEFGLGQRPFFLGDEVIFSEMERQLKTDINYWLLSWKNYYGYALENAGGNAIIFNYERFCEDPAKALRVLFERLEVTGTALGAAPFELVVRSAAGVDEGLLGECVVMYEALAARAGGLY
jgi:hypothetical protein